MTDLLIKVIPLALASLISPVMLGISVLLISNKENFQKKVSGFILGSILAALLLTVAGFLIGTHLTKGTTSHYAWIFDYVIALILLFFAFKVAFSKKKEKKSPRVTSKNIVFQWIIIGLLIVIVNDSAVLYMLQVKEIYQTNINIVNKIIVNLFSLLFLLIPGFLPLLINWILPEKTAKVTGAISGFMNKYGNIILGLLFFVFAAYYLLKGMAII